MALVDKFCNQQVLGCLIKNPMLLSQTDKYRLTLEDFSSKFEKVIFANISTLFHNGATQLTIFDVENLICGEESHKKFFEQNNGSEYLRDIEELANLSNFEFYYNKLKKINLLRDLKKMGYDISDFYVEDLADPNSEKINSQFDELTVQNITDTLKKKLLSLEKNYSTTSEIEVRGVLDGLQELIDTVDLECDIGLPIQGTFYNQIIDGAQKGALTIRSGCSGLGKTRQAIGDACMLAFPLRYNSTDGKWEQVGSNEKVLFIITEQTFKQVQKMVLAYVTDINESRFKYGRFTPEERELLKQGMSIIERYKDNLIFLRIPNPTIEQVKLLIRENCLTNDISYVFYDYIFIGPSLLHEFNGFHVRNDKLFVVYITFPSHQWGFQNIRV